MLEISNFLGPWTTTKPALESRTVHTIINMILKYINSGDVDGDSILVYIHNNDRLLFADPGCMARLQPLMFHSPRLHDFSSSAASVLRAIFSPKTHQAQRIYSLQKQTLTDLSTKTLLISSLG